MKLAVAGLVLAAGAASAGATSLARGPYLQKVTHESALVVWRTTAAAACTLAYTPAGGGATLEATSPSGTQHVVALQGLAPATRYDYSIRSGGLLAGGAGFSVDTAPVAATSSPVRFLVWGDSGKGDAAQMAVAAAMNAESANFALHTGDIIYPSGEADRYDPRYFQPYAPLLRRTPVWAVAGNHDVPNTQAFLDAWYLPTNPVDGSELYYSFDYGDIHVVALNSNATFSTSVRNWIAADLAASRSRWKIVFFHHTIYSCSSYHGSDSYLISTLGPLFDAHGVDLVFTGHDHHFERSHPLRGNAVVDAWMQPNYVSPQGTIYVVTGGGSVPRSPGASCWHSAHAIGISHFTRVEVDGDSLSLEAVDTNRQVFDRITIAKNAVPPPPPQTVSLLGPLGGENVLVGQPLDVRWIASPEIANLRVELSRSGSSGPWEMVWASTANDGVETWTATAPASDNCWMRVADAADGTPSAKSSASFRVVIPPDSTTPPPPPGAGIVRINFQPSSALIPPGHQPDHGLVFDATRGYGWSVPTTVRVRNSFPGDPRDSFAEVTNNAPATWEIVVPNGSYLVGLTCGDPFTSATHRVAIEGQLVVADVYTTGGNFVSVTNHPVVVADGRLTLQAGGNGQITRTKVNALDIMGTGLTIASPAGGETFCTGTPTPLRWSGTDASATLRIELSRNGANGPWETLFASTPNDGEVDWSPTGAGSDNCLLRILNPFGALLAMTPLSFGIVEPQVSLVAPNGGEIWLVGSVHEFAWTSRCSEGQVRLEASRSGADGPWEVVLDSTPDDGGEPWTLRAEDVGWTHVRVLAWPSGTSQDVSDAPFQVVVPPLVALVAPNGGETLRVGDKFEILWSAPGVQQVRLDLLSNTGTWEPIASSLDASVGRTLWTVPDRPGTGRYVRVTAVESPALQDSSDSDFAITPPPVELPSWRFSFQPDTVPPPSGSLADHGLPYTAERGFGWNSYVSVKSRGLLPGDCRDSFAQMVNTGSGTWNLDLPNGDYRVSLVCGDPLTSGTHRIALEGKIVVQDVYASGGNFVTREQLLVRVQDGQLTMTVGGNGQITSTKIACIEVTVVPPRGGRRGPVDFVRLPSSGFALNFFDTLVRGDVRFELDIPQRERTRIEVHDVRGRRVAVLLEADLPAGRHPFRWTPVTSGGDRLASGVYFLRARAADHEQVRKFIVLR